MTHHTHITIKEWVVVQLRVNVTLNLRIHVNVGGCSGNTTCNSVLVVLLSPPSLSSTISRVGPAAEWSDDW